MSATTVSPAEFTFVKFENAPLVTLLDQLRDVLALGDVDISLTVQEQVPFGRAKLLAIDPIELDVESGALEDPLRPRMLSTPGSADILGVLLLRARDLRTEGFDGPEIDDELEQPIQVAWDIYSNGRLARALAAAGDPIDGFRPQIQRRRYTFRTRHGFSDLADDQFARLWSADGLTFPEIVAVSRRATDAAA